MNHLLTESLVCSHRCQVSWHLDNSDPLRLNREQASEAEIQAEGDMAVDGGSSGEPQVKGAGGGGSFKDWYMEQYVSSFDDDLDEIRKQPDFATGDVSRLITAIKSGADVRLLRMPAKTPYWSCSYSCCCQPNDDAAALLYLIVRHTAHASASACRRCCAIWIKCSQKGRQPLARILRR